MYPLLALYSALTSSRTRRTLQGLALEASAFLDAVTRPGQFVSEIEALRVKPARVQQA